MARTPQNFADTSQLSTSAANVIDGVPTDSKVIVRTLSFRNTGAVSRAVTVYIVASSGAASTLNELDKKSIPAGKVWNVVSAQGVVLNEGMTLQAKQDAGADVNANCSGTLIT
jgi:hypothetical protein